GQEEIIKFSVVNVLTGPSGIDSAPHGINSQTARGSGTSGGFASEDIILISVVPNPASRSTTIWVEGEMMGDIEVYITDILGKRVYSQTADKTIRKQHVELPLSGLSQGLFFVNVKIGQQLISEKIIVQR
ncbi:MAG: T9SS type A sorting domain-containing protein, partial [Bacteroidota bacterium]